MKLCIIKILILALIFPASMVAYAAGSDSNTEEESLYDGLESDLDRKEKNSPIQTVVERYTQLKGVVYVDEIIPYGLEKDLEDILSMYPIDVRILGEEYRDKDFTGKDICRKRDIELHFNKRDHRFSSSDLRRRVCEQ